jgi:hypothetical protein
MPATPGELSMSEHKIIEAADTPMSIGLGDLALTISWPDGSETVEHVSEQAAKLLGYQRPDPEPPAPPAWMVEVAREAADGYGNGIVAVAERAIELALERGHVVEPRPVPTDEELLKAAREDAAQVNERRGYETIPNECRRGFRDGTGDVQCALQARRNMLREGAVAASAVPSADYEAALRQAWDAGRSWARMRAREAVDNAVTHEAGRSDRDLRVSALLATLPTREA